MRKTANILLLVILGMQFNSLPIIWGGYYVFAHDYFVSHCENTKSPSCQGKCQARKLVSKSETSSSEESTSVVSLQQLQPVLIAKIFIPPTTFSKRVLASKDIITIPLAGISRSTFHPPKVA